MESGPAGGAILASRLATQCGFDEVLSFDMGGTTAKICLIDHGKPQYARSFEVARAYRFMKGSGLPLRIPVVEMVEIGAGGGSIASVDAMRRIPLFDARTGKRRTIPLYWRFELLPGAHLEGPAIIAEDETSTLVTAAFTATINALGYILMQRRKESLR